MPTKTRKTQTLAEIIGHNVAHYRNRAGWTQAQLAAKVKLNRVTVARIETGTNYPSIELLFRLADLFRVHTDDFRRADESVYG